MCKLSTYLTLTPNTTTLSNTTMSDTEDKKPEGSEPITIRVKDQNGEETMFKVKKSTKMAKVFK